MLRGFVATATATSITCLALTAPNGTAAPEVALAAGSAPSDPFKIYSSLPLGGPFAPQSRDMVRAIDMALADHGGRVGGHPIRHVSLDDTSPETGFPDPEHIAASARTAAKDPATIAYIGNFSSFASAISIPILNRAGVLQVSPSNTSVGLTRPEGAGEGEPETYYPTGRRTYGRVVPADHTQAGAVVSYLTDHGCPDVYIVNDRQGYGTSLATLVAAAASANGVEVVANDSVKPSPRRFREAAKRVADSGAGCFFFGGYTPSGAPRLFREVGKRAPDIELFGPDGVAESYFTNRLGEALEERVFMTNPTLSRRSYPPRGQRFLATFKKAYGHQPEPFAIYAYEAMSAVLKAIQNAHEQKNGDEGRSAVVKAFFGISDRKSVLGRYSIDEYGDTTLATYGGFRVVDGEVAFDKVLTAVPPP